MAGHMQMVCLALASVCLGLAHSPVLLADPLHGHAGLQGGQRVLLTWVAFVQVDIGDNDAVPPAVPEDALHEIPKLTCRTSNERHQ